jgi:SAM-dependent methyltransferase
VASEEEVNDAGDARHDASAGEADDAAFARWLAEVWDEEIEPHFARRHWEPLIESLDLDPRAQVLVAGCSTGAVIAAILRKLTSRSQGRVIALEARGPLLEKARARVEELDRRRVFLRGEPMRTLRFAAGVFDVVVSSLAWLDLPEPGVALEEFHRVLVPGGEVALSLPLAGTFQEVYDLFAEVTLKYDLPEVQRRIEEQRLRRHPEPEAARMLLEGVGFRDVTIARAESDLTFGADGTFIESAVVQALFAPAWREAAGEHAAVLLRHTTAAIETYFGSEPFQVRVVAGRVRARKPRATA